jgi:hypothetical protein
MKMALIVIDKSVGRGGVNQPVDVAAITAALVAVGVDRGGVLFPPLTIADLGDAIEAFQTFQTLPYIDGRVDPGGSTIGRINEILNPAPPVVPGKVRPLQAGAGMATAVNDTVWSPVEASLVSDYVFNWEGVTGQGTITYFQLDEQVVPRWFGALVPSGTTEFDKLHIFFHPTPGQAGYVDSQYHGLGNWTNIFHYLSDDMGVQFCSAAAGRVLIMPLMTQSAAPNCGIFPQRWEDIAGQILGMLKTGDFSGAAPPVAVSSVVVSSFSSGITYSHHFRSNANLGARLSGIIDFDGLFSTYNQLSAALTGPAGHVIRMQQMFATPQMISGLAAQNIFPLSPPRWSPNGPYPGLDAYLTHGKIPQVSMAIAAWRAG